MSRIRSLIVLIAAMIVVVMLHGRADAFWGFGSGRDREGSGLDLEQGYDRNTVITLTGRVAVMPDSVADPVTVEILSGNDRLTVVIGPRWYWQDDNIEFNPGDQLTVRGSRAQGKDGRIYLLAQKILRSDQASIDIRSETGKPNWAGGFRGGQAGPQQRSGGARRGR